MLNITDGPEVSRGASSAERQAKYRRTPAGKLARKSYRANGRSMTNAKYLSRPFVPIDGEGITMADGTHTYTLLALIDENDQFRSIANGTGLASREIFDFLLEHLSGGSGIPVIYGASYDWNMWLGDLPKHSLERLYQTGRTWWAGYRLAWQRGKAFRIGRGDATVTIYDCVSFFQKSFVAACDEYLGDWPERSLIVANKALRGSFTEADTEQVAEYNCAELLVLRRLMGELRERLNRVRLRPRRWDGPGAVASALLRRQGIKHCIAESPAAVATAARHAYAGGRFEPIRFGHVKGPAYQYDINSAYPSAIRHLPNLSRGRWVTDESDEEAPFALYHIEYEGAYADIPGALFRRDANGTICYPLRVTGWYWTPEYLAARDYCRAGLGTMRVTGRHVFVPDDDDSRPFEFVEKLYAKRRALKAANDGAHVALKLALNSLYGKFAQQVGWRILPSGDIRIPPFHCLEWAGYVTSCCRAEILRAIVQDPESIIAIETDAVFSSRPLTLPVGGGLGEWEESRYSSLTYVQSGFYFADGQGGKAKTRGVDRGNLSEGDVLTLMSVPDSSVTVSLARFVTLGVGLHQSLDRWRKWERQERRIELRPGGKRVHALDCTCESGQWHLTMCPMLNDSHSAEFPVEWINPNPDMRVLAEMRGEPNEWD